MTVRCKLAPGTYVIVPSTYEPGNTHFPYSSEPAAQLISIHKGNRTFADLRYVEEDSFSLSTLIFSATKGLLRIYTLHIPPEALKK